MNRSIIDIPNIENLIAVDTGLTSLSAVGPNGVIDIPKPPRGTCKNGAEKFAWQHGWLLSQGPVVEESANLGACGAEPELINEYVSAAPNPLLMIDGRAVKNFAKDRGESSADYTDAEAAALIREIVMTTNYFVYPWVYNPKNPQECESCGVVTDKSRLHRRHTAVRPYDKRDYKDPKVDEYMALLPEYDTLPEWIQIYLFNGKKKTPGYAPAKVMPFAMALTEPSVHSRATYEQVIGAYARGYPSFYRRAAVKLMQDIAKKDTGKRYIADVTRAERKEAWKKVTKIIRVLYSEARHDQT